MALACFAIVRSRTRDEAFVVYQSDFLSHLDTRFVVPLIPASSSPATIRLNPIFDVDGELLVLATQFSLALRVNELSDTGKSLEAEQDKLRDAFDFLTLGF